MNEEKNYWYSIWFRPGDTIRDIVDSNPGKHLLLFAILGGLSQSLASTASLGFGNMMSANEIFMISLLSGPFAGLFYIFGVGWLLHYVLFRLGGTAPITETRTAIAWSWVPIVATLPLWGVKFILFRNELFTLEKPFLESEPILNFFFGIFQFADITLYMWTVVILIAGLSKVHKLPVRKTVSAFLLLNVLMFIPSVIIMTLCAPGIMQ
jgi:hypothetical protein